MSYLLFSCFLLFLIIGYSYGRIVNFNLLAFGNQVSVTYNGKTLSMNPVDGYSRVFSVSGVCPDEEF
eukprot:jgi/Orpsp1_1/1179761/evm.model.c7180000070675.1